MAGHRSRRRPLFFVLGAAAITGIVVIAQGAASSRPSAPEAVQAYLDQVRPGVQRSTEDGGDFNDVRANAAKLGRNGIDRRLDRLASSVGSTLTSMESLTPPPSMRVAHAYLVAALGVRAKAVTEARPGLDAALTAGPGPDQGVQAASDALAQVGSDVELGDRAIGLFAGALPPGAEVPTNAPWVHDASTWTLAELTVFVSGLRSSATARPVHDVAMVAFQTDPTTVGMQGTAQVIPVGKAMTVTMVVENVGNQPEKGVLVQAVLTLADGSVSRSRDFVDLAPGQRLAVGPLVGLRPVAGTTGTLVMTAGPVPGESNAKDASITAAVAFR